MVSLNNQIADYVLGLPRNAKRTVAIFCDLSLCLICVILAFYLRLDQLVPFEKPLISSVLISIFFALPIFWLMGLYRTIFRYSGFSIVLSVFMSVLVYGSLYFCVITLYRIEGVPRSIGIIQPMLLFFLVSGSRLLIKFSVGKINKKKKIKSSKVTLIYGCGSAGRQLASSLENNFEFKLVGFLDDDKKLHNQVLEGHTIFAPDKLEELIQSKSVELVLLALPSINRFKRNQILKKIRKFNLVVQTLPTISEILDGRITVSDIKELDINDILNRESVPPKKNLLLKNIDNKAVMVTGAGGSIGSEICRQIIRANPKTLILCELNEFSLYKIHEELKLQDLKFQVVPILINIQDYKKIDKIIKIFGVNTIYHSAAYKHVPLVEENICEGVMNNVFSTFSIAECAIKRSVSNFVLISSDKAVRPTNVMGATKRLSELCVQAIYDHYKNKLTNMAIVRFGNVLESSGSVIPKFKKQIKQGGPVTLTHKDVTRYFMTVTEAAQLVIQAGAMSKLCDVFVLDMGDSVKIKDLIHRIINLSGFSIKDQDNKDGDIEIKIIGLRPGEKLFEELLLGDNPQPTEHDKIKKAQDPFIPLSKLEKSLNDLKINCLEYRVEKVKDILSSIVDTYKSDFEIVDHIHIEKLKLKNKKKVNN